MVIRLPKSNQDYCWKTFLVTSRYPQEITILYQTAVRFVMVVKKIPLSSPTDPFLDVYCKSFCTMGARASVKECVESMKGTFSPRLWSGTQS